MQLHPGHPLWDNEHPSSTNDSQQNQGTWIKELVWVTRKQMLQFCLPLWVSKGQTQPHAHASHSSGQLGNTGDPK